MDIDIPKMGATTKSSDSSSGSDSDSDNDINWKKKSTRKHAEESDNRALGLRRHTGEGQKRPKKGHEMWTENLTDQVLSETFGHCKLKKAASGVYSRGSESYEFDQKLNDDRPEVDMNFDYDYDQNKVDEDGEVFGVLQDKKKFKKPKVKERIGEKQTIGNFTVQKVVQKIVHKLKEEKHELIQRCVQFLGTKKCLELLNATLDVEDAGGMKTNDGTRRRTPGGVFLQLLRNDPNIRQDCRKKIFEDERKLHHESKKAFRKMKRRQNASKKTPSAMNVDSDEKVLPTRQELFLESCKKTVEPVLQQESQKSVTFKASLSDLEDGEIAE